MKLQYLGTAAAEAIPAIFCTCPTCKRARELGGKNIRTRSQAIIDDKLLIDLPADTYSHSICAGIDLTHVHHILNTHVHHDHLYPAELYNYYRGFANLPDGHPNYHFWGGEEMVDELSPIVDSKAMEGRVVLHALAPFEPTKVGQYLVTALPAHHGTHSPYIYMIESEGKTLLYAHDTGTIKEEVWDYFAKCHPHFDLISMDCTFGSRTLDKLYSHPGFGNVLDMADKMQRLGYIDDNTVKVVNHFSHNAPDVNYEDHAVYEKEGFLMSYDGMVVEF